MPELAPIMQTTKGLGSELLAGVMAGVSVLCRVAVMEFIVSFVARFDHEGNCSIDIMRWKDIILSEN